MLCHAQWTNESHIRLSLNPLHFLEDCLHIFLFISVRNLENKHGTEITKFNNPGIFNSDTKNIRFYA